MNEQASSLLFKQARALLPQDACSQAKSEVPIGARVVTINESFWIDSVGNYFYVCTVWYSMTPQVPLLVTVKNNQNG